MPSLLTTLRRRPFLLLYLFLLLASTGVRRFAGERALATATTGEREPPVVLLAAPSAGGDALAARRGAAQQILVLDPFARETAGAAPGALAESLLAELERRELRRFDLVAIGWSGRVALALAARAPERVRSLALVSSPGPPEVELLAAPRLNAALLRLYAGAAFALRELSPHFGWLDAGPLSRPFVAHLLATRAAEVGRDLAAVVAPTRLVHGRRDFLVPAPAVEELRRRLPQSEIAWSEGGHALARLRPDEVAQELAIFWRDVDAGLATGRDGATGDRLARAAFEPLRRNPQPATGFALLVALALLALATLVSEDLASIGAGLLVAHGSLGFVAATLACLAGIFVGDLLLFATGRFLGRPALSRPPLAWFLSPEAVARASDWFTRRGPRAILITRFLPGTRLPTYFAAGALHTPLSRFLPWFLLAAALWTPLLVGFAALAGDAAQRALIALDRQTTAGAIALLLLLWLAARLAVDLATWRGRRLLLGRWRRLTRWEFWPSWLINLPLVLYVLGLGLRHRRLTLFTAANPAMPHGGFVLESKSGILASLADGARVARFTLLPRTDSPAERLASLDRFLAEGRLDFPVVLKPDVGQRGEGVAIVRDRAAAAAYLAAATTDTVAQEYVPGEEFGVFYLRRPSEPRGKIFSITTKEFPHVTGDGRRTLEELILADDRAVCMAPLYLEKNTARLEEVPAAGERVQLVEIGNHCRGTVFRDGRALATEELVESMESLSRSLPGFYFGRYDLRVPSAASLRAGVDLKVIELNGVTSEATHIYEPGASLLSAWRTLAEQWRMAFAIGAENLARGARATPLGVLLPLLLAHLRGERSARSAERQ